MFSSQHPQIDPNRYYTSPSELLWQFSREAADERARAAAQSPQKACAPESGSNEPTEPTTSRAQRAVDTSKPYTELVVDALRDQLQSGEIPHPPAPAQRVRLKHIKRVVDRRGVVRIYYVRGGKPHIRLDAPEGTPAFLEAYETAQREKALRWKARMRPSGPRRSMSELVDLYQQTDDYARLAPQTQRVYDRVLRRLLHVEQLAGCNAESIGRQRIKQIIDRHAGAPAAAADLLKKFRILFQCAIVQGWRSDDPTRGVTIHRRSESAARRAA